MTFRNILTQVHSDTLPAQIGATYNPTWEMCKEIGWRQQVDVPDVAPGYERLTGVRWVQDPGDREQAIGQYTDTLIADRLAAEEAARLAAAAALKALQSDLDDAELIIKALGLTVLDEMNLLRTWVRSYVAAVAGAATLAALKTATAELSAMPNRTAAQLKAAVKTKAGTLP